jgi:hypothetical protein
MVRKAGFSLAALVVLALAPLADAQQPDPIAKAKQAGIKVDPAAEELMRKAPPGSWVESVEVV